MVDLRSGFLKRHKSIISEFRKTHENDEEGKQNTPLSLEISRHSFLIAVRLESAKEVIKISRLNSALTLMNQAQLLTSTDIKEARKLFNLAKRLGK